MWKDVFCIAYQDVYFRLAILSLHNMTVYLD